VFSLDQAPRRTFAVDREGDLLTLLPRRLREQPGAEGGVQRVHVDRLQK